MTRASSAPAREAKPVAAAEPEVTEPDEPAESPLEDLDLDITLERRQRRLDDDLDPELLQIFLDEAHELVPAVGAAMRDWRDNPDNPALGHALVVAQVEVPRHVHWIAADDGLLERKRLVHAAK